MSYNRECDFFFLPYLILFLWKWLYYTACVPLFFTFHLHTLDFRSGLIPSNNCLYSSLSNAHVLRNNTPNGTQHNSNLFASQPEIFICDYKRYRYTRQAKHRNCVYVFSVPCGNDESFLSSQTKLWKTCTVTWIRVLLCLQTNAEREWLCVLFFFTLYDCLYCVYP